MKIYCFIAIAAAGLMSVKLVFPQFMLFVQPEFQQS